ncbi:MAG TPA: response regulator [Candidatus Acidoferrum sp.]|jgi:sigma-B regulation protein RsbU (phosphoserine phosphatase)|nr:response regulator [Candidatus Acidoferrum sp.]
MNILIVDDDPTSRIVLDATLKKLGHQVTAASSADEALKVLESGHVPVLISDMVMPGMNGLDLCRRIRAANRPLYTYIILLTMVSGKYGYLVGMKAGADDFIGKPFDEDMLAARLVAAERLLSLHSQVKQLTGLLPICCVCKKVRDDQNYWQQVEAYIAKRTDAKFSHSYCPSCFDKAVREIEAMPEADSPVDHVNARGNGSATGGTKAKAEASLGRRLAQG